MQLRYDLFVIYIRTLIGTKGTETDSNYRNSKNLWIGKVSVGAFCHSEKRNGVILDTSKRLHKIKNVNFSN
jgi:hypothetical protein